MTVTNSFSCLKQKHSLSSKPLVWLWHSLLKANGGNLVQKNAFGTWLTLNTRMIKGNTNNGKPTGRNSKYRTKDDGTMVTIPHLETNKARHTLGVWLAPDGNNETEYQYLLGLTNIWKSHMIMAKIP